MMRKSLPDILASMDKKTVHALPYEAKALHFEQWDYWRSLPARVGDYELYITPDNPLPYINGSFIFWIILISSMAIRYTFPIIFSVMSCLRKCARIICH